MIALPGYAQLFTGSNRGFNIGVVSALGNKFQRVGLTFQAYYYRDFAEVNAEVNVLAVPSHHRTWFGVDMQIILRGLDGAARAPRHVTRYLSPLLQRGRS